MKKVCFVFAIFAVMFLTVACDGNTKLEDLINTDVTDAETDADTDADTDATDQTDTATDPNDPNNQNDPNDPNNQNDPNDPNNQNDPNDPNDPNNQNDPNDTDANDTDANDTDANDTDSNDTDSNDTDTPDTDIPDTDNGSTDPCTDPNPCETIEHSDGVCTVETESADELFSCGCESDILGNYMWYDGKCRQVVTKHQCQQLAEFVQATFGVPDWVTNVVEFVCHCFTDECVIIWEP
ncbi:hypothetical protein II898_04315 [bacterium]|nr:hypothetical protein [bacterium]